MSTFVSLLVLGFAAAFVVFAMVMFAWCSFLIVKWLISLVRIKR